MNETISKICLKGKDDMVVHIPRKDVKSFRKGDFVLIKRIDPKVVGNAS